MKKKLLALVLAAAMTLSLASCGGSKTETPSTGSDNSSASSDNSSAEGATYKVGICQLVQHPALDAATQGFIDALNEALPGQVEFENKNASGEANNCGTIVNGFVSEGVDLIMANATAALTAAASATADIPILGTSITEYGVALGIEEYWKTLGLQNCLLDTSVDIAQLKAAYEQASDLDRLSMFISYFTEPFASAEESALAQQTATAITRYILEHYGIDALVGKDDIAYKQEWLQSIGVDRIYSDPYAQVLQDYRFTKANGYALVAITSLNHRFYLQPVEDMQTAKDVRIFLYEAAAYSQSLLDLFREEAPDYYKTVKSRWEGQLNIFCNTGGGSYVQPTARKVKLQLSYAYMHELTHILHPTPKNIRYATEILPYEGLCEYVSSLFPFYSNTRMCYEDVLCKYQHTGDP